MEFFKLSFRNRNTLYWHKLANASWQSVKLAPAWEIYDMLGRKIMTRGLNSGINKTTINVRTLAQGAYSYKVKNEEGEVFTGKLLIE